MAERELNSIASLLVRKSIIDAYLEIICEKQGGKNLWDTDTKLSLDKAIENPNRIHRIQIIKEKLDSNHANIEEVDAVTIEDAIKADFIPGIGMTEDRKDITSFKNHNNNESEHDGDGVFKKVEQMIQSLHKNDDGSNESEDTDDLVSPCQNFVIDEDSFTEATDDKVHNGSSVSLTPMKHKEQEAEEKQTIISSTPIKVKPAKSIVPSKYDISMQRNRKKLDNFATNGNLSSNLAVMIGDISGIDNTAYSDGYVANPVTSFVTNSQQRVSKTEDTDTFIPATLDLSDLEVNSLVSQRDSSLQSKDVIKSGGRTHQNDVNDLRQYYEKELQKLNHEKDQLMSLLRTPCYERTFSRIPEIARKELEQKSLLNERKNYKLSIENHQLQSLCFDLERKVRILKADKAILQERNLKVEQQRRKTSEELSSTQDLLRNALSERRLMEDELYYVKKKEFNTSSRLSDCDATLRELREDLNRSTRDCTDKEDVIQNLTRQNKEIQSNLNDALEQISRLEDASSQRSREKNIFHKLLEEYDVLYNQHQRIRNLYKEALHRLDDTGEDAYNKSSLSKGDLFMKPPARGSSFRKKWSMSPTSPSIREQNDTDCAQNEAGNIHEVDLHETQRGTFSHKVKHENSNRHSLGGVLSLGSPTDFDSNNNNTVTSKTFGQHGAFSSARNYEQRSLYRGIYGTYTDEDDSTQTIGNRLCIKDGNQKAGKDWVIQNVDGITRFDVIFSPSERGYEEAERDLPKDDDFSRLKKEFPPTEDTGHNRIASEISLLERDLTKLSAEKNGIESQLSRLPMTGSGRARRSNAEKKELLEKRLDEIVKFMSHIRRVLRQHKVM